MKTLLFIILLIATATINLKAQTVYISESGKKFHKKNCTTAQSGKKGVELKEAKKMGYTECKVCKPEEAAEEKSKKKGPRTVSK